MSDRLGRVLVHPLRHRLLLEYYGEPANPSQVAHRLGEPLNLVSYHTGVLARHRCVELVRTERRRGAMTRFYRSTVPPVIEDGQWESVPAQLRRALVLGTLSLAAEDARRAALDGGFDAAEAHLSRTPLELDDEAVEASARCLREALEEIADIAGACRARGSAGRRRFEIVMLGFDPGSDEPPPVRRASAPATPDRGSHG
jgi:hypothetical protein